MFIGYVVSVNIFAQINANLSSGAPALAQGQAQGQGGGLFLDIMALLASQSGQEDALLMDAPKGAGSLALMDAASQAAAAGAGAANAAPVAAPAFVSPDGAAPAPAEAVLPNMAPQAETGPGTSAEATAATGVKAAAAIDMVAPETSAPAEGAGQKAGAGQAQEPGTATGEPSLPVAVKAPGTQAAVPNTLVATPGPVEGEARRQPSTAGQTVTVDSEPRGAIPLQGPGKQAGSDRQQALGPDTGAATRNGKADAFGDSVSRLNDAARSGGASEGSARPAEAVAAPKADKPGPETLWQPAQKAAGPARSVQAGNEALVAESTFKAALKQGMGVEEAAGNTVHARRASVAAEELPAPVRGESPAAARAEADVAPVGQAGGRPQAAPAAQRAATGPRVINLDGHVFTIKNTSDTTIEVTLKPDGLGKLEISVSLERGLVNTQINAADPAGKEIIQRNMQSIMQILERDGLNVGGFSVALRQGGQGDGSHGHGGSAQRDGASVGQPAQAAPSGPRQASADGRLSIYV